MIGEQSNLMPGSYFPNLNRLIRASRSQPALVWAENDRGKLIIVCLQRLMHWLCCSYVPQHHYSVVAS